MIVHDYRLPLTRHAELLEISRSNVYYVPAPASEQVMDRAMRRTLAWRVSNTLTADFCVEAVEEAIDLYGKPEIFNTDQGTQFASDAFTGLLHSRHIAISMDGQECWRENVFVERLWRSIKYEEDYVHAYETVSTAKQGVARYLHFYNTRRPHTALGKQTPDTAYFNQTQLQAA